ncbi:hypothetical protein [Acinetobacter bouvetii]|uniref:hypothetical protein n=1 Tax=Acinetobacter bouvetii TaxID=202951 RepID=UPI0003650F0F|nr:hypothetical protein [Acinetobacter bouvetii]BCU64099.1 hypothetical protein ACBO_08900 [Acinetobacter bouvetii]
MEIKELLKIIHDAEILSIQSGSKDQLSVEIQTDFGQKLKLDFTDVKSFRFIDFIQQNIISKLNFLNLNDHTNHDIEYYLKWVTSLSDAGSYLNTESIENFIDKITAHELQLVYFEPSCGVEGVILYESLEIFEVV